jgi:hypothetical protein
MAKSSIFNFDAHKNKKLAAEYVLSSLNPKHNATLVHNEKKSANSKMKIGVRSSILGLIHITCSSITDPNAKIRAFKYEEVSKCIFEHNAFVWEDTSNQVITKILTRADVMEIAKKYGDNYPKSEIISRAIKL